MDILSLLMARALSRGSNTPGGGNEEWIGDGNTHIWITLHEGRTSPMLGVCPKGTVTVDWGDGTTPDVLTGTKVTSVKWTPTHEYAKPGDYVITLTVDGEMGFSGYSSSNEGAYILRNSSGADGANTVYQMCVKKVEAGKNVTWVGPGSFYNCNRLTSVIIQDGVTRINDSAFYYCYSLASVTIPDSVTIINAYAFYYCYSLASATIPDSVTEIPGSAFDSCYSLTSVTIPDSVTVIGSSAFRSCYSLTSVTIPASVTQIFNSTFYNCSGLRFCDFTKHTAVPTLSNTGAFSGIAVDCEIRVPAALVDEWKAATNWSTYASQIVGV